MDRWLTFKNKLFVLPACLILAACASTLIWQSSYSTDYVSLSNEAALDSLGNIYTAGATRLSSPGEDTDYRGLLLKYDADGEFVWQVDFSDVSFVKRVVPFTDDLLVIETGSKDYHSTIEGDGAYFVSTNDGSIVTSIFGEGDHASLEDIDIFENNAYIRVKTAINGDVDTELRRYDGTATLVSSMPIISNLDRLSIRNNGKLYFIDRVSSVYRLHVYDDELNFLSESQPLSEFDYYCEEPVFDAQSNLIFRCEQSVLKYTSEGEFLFKTDYSELFSQSYDDPRPLKVEYGPTGLDIDASGDIYQALTRAKVYIGDLGGLSIVDGDAMLGADIIVMKIDGETGDIAWMDVINSTMFPTSNGIISDFYFPLSLSMINDEMQITFSGYRGEYTGAHTVDEKAVCYGGYEFVYEPLNICVISEMKSSYAKTFYYDQQTGDRNKGSRYSIPYPSSALLDSDKNMVIVGDQTWEAPKSLFEIGVLGVMTYNDMDASLSVESESNIVLEKHRL